MVATKPVLLPPRRGREPERYGYQHEDEAGGREASRLLNSMRYQRPSACPRIPV